MSDEHKQELLRQLRERYDEDLCPLCIRMEDPGLCPDRRTGDS